MMVGSSLDLLSKRAHLIRSASESIAFQSRDLIKAIEADYIHRIKSFKDSNSIKEL